MKLIYNIPMVGKLCAICLSLLVPLALLLYLSVANVNGQIEFSRHELFGNAYLRPLVHLLEDLPKVAAGDKEAASDAAAAFVKLGAVQEMYGTPLQFTPEGLGKRDRLHLSPGRVVEAWRAAQGNPAKIRALIPLIMGMIAHAGDTSNLILDPDLDSYYLMDLTLLALPQTQHRLTEILDYAEKVLAQGEITEEHRRKFNTYAALLQQSDLDRIAASTATAVMEDPNFYGRKPGLKQAVERAFADYESATRPAIALLNDVAAGKRVDGRAFLDALSGARNRAFAYWDAVIKEQDALLSLRMDSLLSDRTTLLAATGASLLAAMLIAIVIVRSINRPLRNLAEVAEDVADGHMESRADVFGRDEIGGLAQAVNGLLDANAEALVSATQARDKAGEEARRANACFLEAEESRKNAETARLDGQRQAAARLEEIVSRLGSSSSGLAEQVDGSSRYSVRQKEMIAETAAAIEEMNASILEVARNASNASEQSRTARERAAEGADIVKDAVEAIGQLKDDALSLKDKLSGLDVQARGIGQIMAVINDIADQTNLLALNAAIEAARAGEAGRGFAVVADEVRKLAEKTMDATKEVGSAISSIQSGAADSTEAMEQTAGLVARAVELAERSREALEDIVVLSMSASDQVDAIAAAAEEQSAASEQITRSTEEVSRSAEDSAESLSHSKQSMDALNALSEDLHVIVQGLSQ
jgi:methyl-accepting chemotaxis protein